jgi:hypothetical protein
MPSAADRAATLDYDAGSGASTMQTQVQDGTDARVWGHLQCMRSACSAGHLRQPARRRRHIHLWATLRESPHGDQPS